MGTKVLHTADWHLGKKLEQCERTEEHQDFLNWLIEKLTDEKIDILIVAGDIFDTGTPSNTALQQYYHFLRQVKNTPCREVIIIGGNHDSISTLNAPKELLKYFNVHIVGGVPEVFTEQIIEIYDVQNELELVVCAVPFLRDKDIRLSISGENTEEREARIKQGISNHYHSFKEHIGEYIKEGVPVISTGHLFAAGSSTSESEKDIHVGNLGQVHGDQFPTEFSYIALGHIHRPQIVNKMDHIRYSGSPIPLSFSEFEDEKQVIVLEIESGVITKIESHKIPIYRKLIRIKGNLETVKNKVWLLEDPKNKYPLWIEVQLDTDVFISDLDEQLNELKKNKPFIDRFFPRQITTRKKRILGQHEEVIALTDLDPKAVFIKKFEAEFGEEDYLDLLITFTEVLEQMQQREN